eukprot:5380950-Pyramimonas_sp.AAC.1
MPRPKASDWYPVSIGCVYAIRSYVFGLGGPGVGAVSFGFWFWCTPGSYYPSDSFERGGVFEYATVP